MRSARLGRQCAAKVRARHAVRRASLAAILAISASACLFTAPADAGIKRWSGGNSTWPGSANWNPSGAPGSLDSVLLDQGAFTATHDALAGFSVVSEIVLEARMTLSLTGGTLSITGTGDTFFGGGLGVYGNSRYIQTGGTFDSGESITVSGLSRFTLLDGIVTGAHGQNIGPGSIYHQGGGTNTLSVTLAGGIGTLDVGMLGNGTSSNFNVLSSGQMTQYGGTLNMLSARVDNLSAYNFNGGTISAGSLNVGHVGLHALDHAVGTFVQSGGTAQIAQTLKVAEGRFTIQDGTLSVGGGVIVGPPSTGALALFEVTGGTMTTGTFAINAVSTLRYAGGSLSFGQMTNAGELRISGAAAFPINAGAGVTSGGTINFDGDGSIAGPGTLTSNGGLLLKSVGAGTSTISAPLSFVGATGTIDVQSGVLELTGAVGSTSSIVKQGPGTLRLADSHDWLSGGALVLDAGFTTVESDLGAGTTKPNITVNSATLSVLSSLSVTNFALTSATSYVGGSGTIAIAGGGSYLQPSGVNEASVSVSGAGSLSGGTLGSATGSFVRILGGGVFEQSGGTVAAQRVSIDPAGSYLMSGGDLNSSTLSIDNGGSFSMSAGSINTLSTYIGPTGTGTFVQSGGTHNAGQFLSLGEEATGSGTYLMSGASALSATEFDVGYAGSGYFSQLGGTISVSSFIALGVVAGGRGTFEMQTDAVLNASNAYVGLTGLGTFNQSSGTNTVSTVLSIGELPGSAGTYTLSGTATVSAPELDVGFQGDGTLVQNGGNVSSPNLNLGARDPVVGTANGHYALNSGTMSAGDLIVGIDPRTHGKFVQGGGHASVSTDLSIAYYSGSQGTLTLSAGTLLANRLQVAGNPDTAGGLGTLAQSGGDLVVNSTLKVWPQGVVRYTGGSFVATNLDIASGGSMTVGPGAALTVRVNALVIAGAGKLDLNDDDLIVDYTGASPIGDVATPNTIANYIAAAHSGGTWSGPGITSGLANASQYALGYGEASDLFGISGAGTATFNGYTVDATTVLVKYTYYGDADLNGLVDFDDYVRIDEGYNLNLTGWTHGDFDYSGGIDFDDYVLIDLAFNTQGGTLRLVMDYLSGDDRNRDRMNGPALQRVVEHFDEFGTGYAQHFLSAVPEPHCLGILSALGGAKLLRRRRRA